MKLNPDCTRDVLTAIEDVVDLQTRFQYSAGDNAPEILKKYSPAEIAYHINQCRACGFLDGCEIFNQGAMILVDDLTPEGHEFLANTRKIAVWEQAKEICADAGSDSLKNLASVAGQLILKSISSKLFIP